MNATQPQVAYQAAPQAWPASATRALLWEIWRLHRVGFLLLTAVFVACAVGYPLLPEPVRGHEMFRTFCFVPMGVSLAALFVLFRFTESDRKERRNGFPARLFALPLSTWHLVTCPMIAAVGSCVALYSLWAALVYAPLGIELPLGWPNVYLATGMLCFQAIVWSLSNWRVGRLVASGIFGACLAVGWLLFRSDTTQMFFEVIYPGSMRWPMRSILLGLLVVIGFSAYLLALRSLARQRRGADGYRLSWSAVADFLQDRLPSSKTPFRDAGHAQSWFEWQRHGIALPLAVTAVLAIITLPAVFVGELSAGMTMLCLTSILLLPCAVSLALGKGFGKSDLWAKNATLAPFVLLRPLSSADWVFTKLKAAGLSAALSWVMVYTVTSWWLLAFCDCSALTRIWDDAAILLGPAKRWVICAMAGVTMVILTWRLLIANLWIGALGRGAILTASVLWTFIIGAVGLHAALWWSSTNQRFIPGAGLLPTMVWTLGILLLLKLWFALWTWEQARQRGLCKKSHVRQACVGWLALTGVLVCIAWLLNPQVTWLRNVSFMLALGLVPIGRVAGCILAFAHSRSHGGSLSLPRWTDLRSVLRPPGLPSLGLGAVLTLAIVALTSATIRSLPRHIDAGGHRLRMAVQGQGAPTVVFEAFGTATLEWWAGVQNRIAPFVTTVAYDHAGHGLSEPGPKPRDARTIAQELHRALQKANLPPPYLLVGHSFGGPYIRVFAGLYPEEVCGLVLVDPSQEKFFDWLRPRFPELNVITAEEVAEQEEWGCSLRSLEQARASVLPPVPITLLTGLKSPDTVFLRRVKPRWLEAHQEWLSHQSQGRHIVTTNSGHGIHVEEPELVASAILDTLRLAGKPKRER